MQNNYSIVATRRAVTGGEATVGRGARQRLSMSKRLDKILRISAIASACALAAAIFVSTAHSEDASRQTLCTKLDLCYCVKLDLRQAIADNVVIVRNEIAAQKAKGKAIGYLSIPLSPAGGGSYAINSEAAGRIAQTVVARLGESSVWILNPAAWGGDHMIGANGADYMYMWTQILEGSTGYGEDFDFFYFVGPTDFAGYFFPLTKEEQGRVKGERQSLDDYLGRLDGVFDRQLASNPSFKKEVEQGRVTKSGFRNYYGLRASVSFSFGSHDEWNIARMLNDRRRGADRFGIANQVAIFFDGQPVDPGAYEAAAASGNAGRCKK